MSDLQRFMSIRAYAKIRGASEGTVRYHVRAGTIVLTNDGKVDRLQADKAWAVRRRAANVGRDANAQSARARIRKARAKLELQRDQVARLHERYAPRADAIAEYEAEAAYLIDALTAMPQREADMLAAELSIPTEKARRLLGDFVALCLRDIGDLEAQLTGVVHRA